MAKECKRGPKETGRGARLYLDKRMLAIVQGLRDFPEIQLQVESLLYQAYKKDPLKGLTPDK